MLCSVLYRSNGGWTLFISEAQHILAMLSKLVVLLKEGFLFIVYIIGKCSFKSLCSILKLHFLGFCQMIFVSLFFFQKCFHSIADIERITEKKNKQRFFLKY